MRYLMTAALAAFFTSVYAAEEIKEMAMATDVGEVVLTLEPCPITPNYGFPYLAYATEKGQPDHLGCWFEPTQMEGYPQNQIVNVWFFEVSAVASYNKKLFKPRQRL
jgi:hypothetical protein